MFFGCRMRLHTKIDEDDLQENGLLLNDDALSLIKGIEDELSLIRQKQQPVLRQQDKIHKEIDELNKSITLLANPQEALEPLLLSLIKESNDSARQYLENITNTLQALQTKFNTEPLTRFLNRYIEGLSPFVHNEYCDLNELYCACSLELDELYSENHEQFPIEPKSTELNEQLIRLFDARDNLTPQFQEHHFMVDTLRVKCGIDLEIDYDFNLVKLPKTKDKLPYSVLYIEQKDSTKTPYILYRGKNKMLGAGGFGKVKLCQNLLSQEWCAIKIQKPYMKEGSQKEIEILSDFHAFKGEQGRNYKYYTVQSLLFGENLKTCLEENKLNSLSTRLLIAKQAISLVEQFHQHYLHRDIKPENFIWDQEKNELYLCDYGLACDIGNDGNYFAASGSGTFLAPEINDAYHTGHVHYTKKSDIFALGKTLEELFEGCPTPSEINDLISQMTKSNPEERSDNTQAFMSVLDLAIELTLPDNKLGKTTA